MSAIHASRFRLAGVGLCLLLAAGAGHSRSASSVPAVDDPAASQLWPRVFYRAEQRAEIEARRRADDERMGVASAALVYKLDGVSHGRKGATAWINGRPLRQGERHDTGRQVHIGRDGVRLQMAGQPDIVLKPGQQATEKGLIMGDLVPAGSYQVRASQGAVRK